MVISSTMSEEGKKGAVDEVSVPAIPSTLTTIRAEQTGIEEKANRIGRMLLPFLILAALLLRLPGLNGELTDHDSWRQTGTAAITRNFLEDPRIFWPRVDWGAPGPGYVETELQLFPYVVSMVYRVAGEDAIWGRLLALLLTGLSCLVMHRLAQRFLPGWAAVVAVVLFAMAPLNFRYSRAFVSEATVLLFYLVALERFLAYLEDEEWRALLASAMALALALLVKPTSVHLLPMLLLLAASRRGLPHLLSPWMLLFCAIALAPGIAYYAHAAQLGEQYGNSSGLLYGGDARWGNPALWLDPRFYLRLASIDRRWIAGTAGSLLAALGLFGYRKEGWRSLAVCWALLLFACYLALGRYTGVEQLGIQHHIYAVPLLALLAAGGLAVLAQRADAAAARIVGVLLLVLLALQLREDLDLLNAPPNRLAQEAGLAVARLSQPDDPVLVLSSVPAYEGGVPNDYRRPDVFFHARRQGCVLARDRQNGQDLVRSLGCGARWFVNFPALNDKATPSFHQELARRMTKVLSQGGFEIYEVRQPGAEQDL